MVSYFTKKKPASSTHTEIQRLLRSLCLWPRVHLVALVVPSFSFLPNKLCGISALCCVMTKRDALGRGVRWKLLGGGDICT